MNIRVDLYVSPNPNPKDEVSSQNEEGESDGGMQRGKALHRMPSQLKHIQIYLLERIHFNLNLQSLSIVHTLVIATLTPIIYV